VWTSNLFSFAKFKFFFQNLAQRIKFGPNIRILGGIAGKLRVWSPKNTDIIVYTDERKVTDRYFRSPISLNRFVPSVFRNKKDNSHKSTVHYDAFNKVVKYFFGHKNLHVVGRPDWISLNSGVSPLPNSAYTLDDTFIKDLSTARFNVVFLHELLSTGMATSEFKELFLKAKGLAERIIVLEHNRDSSDFSNSPFLPARADLRAIAGQESDFEYSVGEDSPDRNMILVYDSQVGD
jgi:hypothetical protein